MIVAGLDSGSSLNEIDPAIGQTNGLMTRRVKQGIIGSLRPGSSLCKDAAEFKSGQSSAGLRELFRNL